MMCCIMGIKINVKLVDSVNKHISGGKLLLKFVFWTSLFGDFNGHQINLEIMEIGCGHFPFISNVSTTHCMSFTA